MILVIKVFTADSSSIEFDKLSKFKEKIRSIKRSINSDSMKLKFTIGQKSFTASLENNPSALAFKKQLPLIVEMIELNDNEKYVQLPVKLPVKSYVPPLIESGDIMLYGDDVLVLFYKSFKTTYRYTKIGKIEQHDLLEKALGDGNVVVSISLEH